MLLFIAIWFLFGVYATHRHIIHRPGIFLFLNCLKHIIFCVLHCFLLVEACRFFMSSWARQWYLSTSSLISPSFQGDPTIFQKVILQTKPSYSEPMCFKGVVISRTILNTMLFIELRINFIKIKSKSNQIKINTIIKLSYRYVLFAARFSK